MSSAFEWNAKKKSDGKEEYQQINKIDCIASSNHRREKHTERRMSANKIGRDGEKKKKCRCGCCSWSLVRVRSISGINMLFDLITRSVSFFIIICRRTRLYVLACCMERCAPFVSNRTNKPTKQFIRKLSVHSTHTKQSPPYGCSNKTKWFKQIAERRRRRRSR